MMEISLSWISWLAIVLIQAIIHFGIIEPRSRKRQEQKQRSLKPSILECPTPTSTSRHENLTESAPSGNMDSETASSRDRVNDILFSSSCGSQEETCDDDPDETDTGENARYKQQQQFCHSKSRSNNMEYQSSSNKDSKSMLCSKRDLNDESHDTSLSLRQSKSFSYGCKNTKTENHVSSDSDFISKDDISCTGESKRCSFPQDEICKNIPSCHNDDEDSYSNEDEEWRNELVQYYCSPVSPSLITMASERAISCYDDMEEDDPVMDAMESPSSVSSKTITSSYLNRTIEVCGPPQKGVLKNTTPNNTKCTSYAGRKGKKTKKGTKHVLFADVSSKSCFRSALAPMVCT